MPELGMASAHAPMMFQKAQYWSAAVRDRDLTKERIPGSMAQRSEA
jgi:hypothetical protein